MKGEKCTVCIFAMLGEQASGVPDVSLSDGCSVSTLDITFGAVVKIRRG